MASIKPYKTAKGRAWRVQYRSPDGRNRTKQGFRTKNEAQAWADKNATTIRTGDWIDPNAGKVTIGELGARWLEMQTHLKPSTLRTTEQTWRIHVKPRWGDTPIRAVRASEVQHWLSSTERSASIVRKNHAMLSQILDMAVRDGIVKSNPAKGVTLPRKAKARKVYLSWEQLSAFSEECGDNAPIVWLLGTVGLRWGELAGLQVQDVDVLRRRISVRRNAVTVGYEVKIGTPKTHESRVVAVPRFVMDMLVPLMDGKAQDAWVWCRADGSPLRVPSNHTWFYCALKRCMEKDPDFPRVTPHGLRHVAAGLMIHAGANVLVVSRQLGHANPAMTLSVYAGLWEKDLDTVANSLEELFHEQQDGKVHSAVSGLQPGSREKPR